MTSKGRLFVFSSGRRHTEFDCDWSSDVCSSDLALAQATTKHPFTFEDMMKLKRLDEPAPSPDGKWVVFPAEDVDLEANTKISHLWIVPATGSESKDRKSVV